MALVRYRLVIIHLMLGMMIVPLGLGRLDSSDLLVRLPALLAVALDAGVAFEIARVYTTRVWTHRRYFPGRLAAKVVRPWSAWLASLGYYMTCLWVVLAIVSAPDIPITSYLTPMLFIVGFLFVGIYKLHMLRTAHAIADQLEFEAMDELETT